MKTWISAVWGYFRFKKMAPTMMIAIRTTTNVGPPVYPPAGPAAQTESVMRHFLARIEATASDGTRVDRPLKSRTSLG